MASTTLTPEQATERSWQTKHTVLAVSTLVLFLLPLLQNITERNLNFYINLFITAFMFIAMSSSWNILGGYTGYISLGHSVFFGIGGYFSAMLLAALGISVFISAPIAGLVSMAFGFLIGFITLRVRGPSFIISTIALLLMMRLAFENWDFIGGSNGLTLPFLDLPVEYSKFPYYYAFLITMLGSLYLSYRVRHAKLGLGLRAISQDEIKSESAGIPTSFYKITAFALSVFFVGVCGALWGAYVTNLKPNTFFLIGYSANMVLMSILGGKGTLAGPVLGSILILALDEFFVRNFGSTPLNIAGTGLVMLLVLLFMPEGVIGTLRRRNRLPAWLDWD